MNMVERRIKVDFKTTFREGYKKGVTCMYKKQEKYLMWLAFVVAGVMMLSIMGRIFGG